MSFILDALKKSESERQRQAGPALLEARIVRPSRRPPFWAVAIGVLLLINFGVVAWLLAHSGASGPAARTPPAMTPAPALTAPATGPLPATVAPAAGAPPGAGPSSSGGLSRLNAPAASPATPPAAPSGSTAADTAGTLNPADLEPAVAPPTGTSSSAGNPDLRNYAELAGALPQLRLDLHVYANNPADRYAFINMHKVREGDVTPEGVRVAQITREGVVLDYRGTEFLLGRE
jgi:general secretion pathway protein B